MSLWTPDEDQQLRELWATDATAAQIGARMGKNKNIVLGRVHRLKLPLRKAGGGTNHARRAAICAAYRRGERIVEIAAKFHTCTAYISKVAREGGCTLRTKPKPKAVAKPATVNPAPSPVVFRTTVPSRPATTPEAAKRSQIMRDWQERLMAAERVMRGM